MDNGPIRLPQTNRLVWNTPLEVLRGDPRFRLLRSWENEQIRIYVFEKTGDVIFALPRNDLGIGVKRIGDMP
jgi:hypothetical protein